MLSVEKPHTPEELVHFGVKGMKWGVRKDRTGSEDTSTKPQKVPLTSEQKKERAKKVAIGVGALAAVAGAAFIAYQLQQSGNLDVSKISETMPSTTKVAATKKIKEITEQTEIVHASRGKNKGFEFFRQGGLPNYLSEYEKVFGADSGKSSHFEKLPDGRAAAAFLDPKGRTDFAGRPIPHQVIIPKSLAANVHNMDDVMSKIWPELEKTYTYGE